MSEVTTSGAGEAEEAGGGGGGGDQPAWPPSSPTLHDRLAGERHVPRPVPSLGLEDAGLLDRDEVARQAGLSSEEAERLWLEAQDEVLAELKGEAALRAAQAALRRASSEDGSGDGGVRRKHRRSGGGSGSEGPSYGSEGALWKFARAAALERHVRVHDVLQGVAAAPVDLQRLDSKEGQMPPAPGPGPIPPSG
ncbi:hypothetical protein PLESTM_000965200 [Pleodorina starrii]|nr:hypothetical protein PLESTM_000965200 [Pleodorina starrii]